jgi:hypothetical protein
MNQRWILAHNETTLIIGDAPEGWDDLKYSITRNETFHGLFFEFTGTLKFPGDGKRFIDDVLDNYDFEQEIGLTIKELDQSTRAYKTKIDGILYFDPDTYVKEELWTTMAFQSSRVHQKFQNRQDAQIAYNRKENMAGITLPGFTDEFVDVILRGKESDTITSRCVYPFEAFNRIIQVICDLAYNPVVSSMLGRTEYGYVENGEHALTMITNGLLMRGWSEAGNTLTEGTANLNMSAKELFQNFSKIFNLGLGFEYSDENDRWEVVIEQRNYFYQTDILFTVGRDISNLKYELGREFLKQKIRTGFKKFVEDSDYGLTEYMNESQFSTPVSIADGELDLVSSYRADGLGFQIAIDNPKVDDNTQNETDIDEDVFLVDSIDDNGTLKSRKDEGFTVIGGLYGQYTIQANVRLSPARNMVRWGDWIKAALTDFSDKNLRFNKAEKLSSLQSQLDTETALIYETRDYAISDLPQTRWSGRIVKFEAPLTREQINIITNNPRGLVKYWDYSSKQYGYGWIKEASTDRVDKDTTWELYEAINVDEVANDMVYVETALPVSFMSGEDIIYVNA